MRAKWDALLSELVGGSEDPDAGRLANEIEREVRAIEERARREAAAYEYLHQRQCQIEAALRQITEEAHALIYTAIDRDQGHWPAWDAVAQAVEVARRALHIPTSRGEIGR